MRSLTNLLASIAGVSLLVGGIGIMNIMLVSVANARVNWNRMAIGARSGIAQFHDQSITLSLVGGVIGVAFGIGIELSHLKMAGMAHCHLAALSVIWPCCSLY